MNDEKTQINPIVITSIFVGILLAAGLIIYFGFFQKEKEEDVNPATIENAIENVSQEEMTKESYSGRFSDFGVDVSETFIFNIELPEKERSLVDPMWNAAYIGFESNRDETASLYTMEDGTVFILSDTESDEVYSVVEWKTENVENSLEIVELQGKKALLSKEAIEETNETKKQKMIEEIAEINVSLTDTFEKLTSELDH